MNTDELILRSYALSTTGLYEEAEALLKSNTGALKSVPGLDLLARLRVEQGDDISARRLWQQVLELDPNNMRALDAIRILGTPWRIRSSFSLVSRLTGLLIISGFALYGAFRLGEIGRKHDTKSEMARSLIPITNPFQGRERIKTFAQAPTRIELVALSNFVASAGHDCWLSVACAVEPLSSNARTRGLGFKRSAIFAESFSEVVGFPYERILIATVTNVAPPFLTLRLLNSKQEVSHETAN
jgi:hypothetical protein